MTVPSVYGSDRGEVVEPARTTAFDVMRFSGQDVERVADVRVTVVNAPVVDYPATPAEAVVTPLDAAGDAVTRNDAFVSLRLRNDNDNDNDNDYPLRIRLIYIVWNMPPAGRTLPDVSTRSWKSVRIAGTVTHWMLARGLPVSPHYLSAATAGIEYLNSGERKTQCPQGQDAGRSAPGRRARFRPTSHRPRPWAPTGTRRQDRCSPVPGPVPR